MPTGFTIAMPPGWRQYLVDDEGRKELTAQLSRRFKELGRPDLDVEGRMLIGEQWRKMQAARVSAVYLPGPGENELVLPISIAVRQHQALAQRDFEASVCDFAGVPVERFETPIGLVLRWSRASRGEGELAEVHSTQLGYAFRLPGGEDERRGMIFIASITHLDETSSAMLALLMEGVDLIMETFRWR